MGTFWPVVWVPPFPPVSILLAALLALHLFSGRTPTQPRKLVPPFMKQLQGILDSQGVHSAPFPQTMPTVEFSMGSTVSMTPKKRTSIFEVSRPSLLSSQPITVCHRCPGQVQATLRGPAVEREMLG
ncbi:BAH and coiled-coil domain-containing protein 1-like isoform X1, partial [Lates japonicus]